MTATDVPLVKQLLALGALPIVPNKEGNTRDFLAYTTTLYNSRLVRLKAYEVGNSFKYLKPVPF